MSQTNTLLGLERWKLLTRHPDAAAALQDIVAIQETPALNVPDFTNLIQRKQRLGSGGYGEVYEAELTGPMALISAAGSLGGVPTMAVKIARRNPKEKVSRQKKYALRELMVWSELNHPNILPLVGMFYTSENPLPSFITLCMPFTVKAYLEQHPTANKTLPILSGIAGGVAYLHARGIKHGDLKAQNILTDEEGNPSIIDFGLSRGPEHTDTTASQIGGSCRWMAPELLQGSKMVTMQSDVYAFSITSYEIVTNAIPFPDLPSDGSVILNVVLNGVRPSKIPLVGDGLWDLWTRCWSASPEDRPIMVEVDSKMKALTDCASHRATHTSRKLLASGSYDNVIRVWDAETGEALQTMTARLSPGESGGVDCPRLSPDGSKLSTTTEDWKSRLWKVASEVSQKIPAVNLMFGDTAASSGTNAVVLSPDGTKLVTAGDDKKVRVWDVASAKLLKQITAPYELYSLAFSPSGDKFATCGNSGSNRFYVWHATKYTRDLFKFEGHTRVVKCIAYSPDATKIVSGSDDTAVGVWDTGTGKRVMTFQGHMESIAAVAVSPNNTYVASAGRDQTVRIWSLDTQHILHCLNGHSDLITSIAFSPSGLSIASASRDKTIRVWEVDAGAEKVCLEGHTGEVTSIAFTYEHVLVSGGRDNTIRIWDPENCKEVKRICRKSGPGPGVVASIAHATLFTVC